MRRFTVPLARKEQMKYRRYKDGCYAVVVGSKRGPCAHSKVEALARYSRSGLIALASQGA